MTRDEWLTLLVQVGQAVGGWVLVASLALAGGHKLMTFLGASVAKPLAEAVSTLLNLHDLMQDTSRRLERMEIDLRQGLAQVRDVETRLTHIEGRLTTLERVVPKRSDDANPVQ